MFCINPCNQFWDERNCIQDKIHAGLKVHVQEIVRMQHDLLEVMFSCFLPSDSKEREGRLGEYVKETLK